MAIGLLIGFIFAVVVALTWATTQPSAADSAERAGTGVEARVSGARPVQCPPGSKRSGAGCIDLHPVHIVACSAKRAVRFYAGRIAYWLTQMGAVPHSGSTRRGLGATGRGCPRYLAHVLQRKSYGLRKAYARYVVSRAYQWDYERWMPAWMIRLGQCEMSLDWSRRWGIYEGAFAFATTTWDGYKLPGYPDSAADATPRQQMNVVFRIAHRLGVAGPWGCWRGPQHAWVRGGLPEYGFYG